MSSEEGEDSPYDFTYGWRLKKKQMEEDIARKNSQLVQLMDDIQEFQEKSEVLQLTVNTLNENLREANDQLDGLASDYSTIKETNQHMQEKLASANEERSVLEARLAEVQNEKEKQEEHFCAVNSDVEKRLDQLQIVLSEREKELDEMKELRLTEEQQVYQKSGQFFSENAKKVSEISKLQQIIESQNGKLTKLSSNLVEATKEIDESYSVIKKLQQMDSSDNSLSKLKEQLVNVRKELHAERQNNSRLKLQLLSAEEDAQLQARDLSAVTCDLNAYLSGDFSLADAVKELKACRNKLVSRESQLEKLIGVTNTQELQLEELVDKNNQLRSLLELEPDETVVPPLGGMVNSQVSASKKTIAKLTKKIKALEEERVNLKTEVYALMRELSNTRASVQITSLELPIREALINLAEQGSNNVSNHLKHLQSAVESMKNELHVISVKEKSDVISANESDVMTSKRRNGYEERSLKQIEGSLSLEMIPYTTTNGDIADECSIESGQLYLLKENNTQNTEANPINFDQLAPAALERMSEMVLKTESDLKESLKHVEELTWSGTDVASSVFLMQLLQTLQENISSRNEFRVIMTGLKELHCNALIALRQMETKVVQLGDLEALPVDEKGFQHAYQWCQKFHKERFLNIELKEKHSLLKEKHDEALLEMGEYEKLVCKLNPLVTKCGSKAEDRIDCASIALQTMSSSGSDASNDAPHGFSLEKLKEDLANAKSMTADLQKIVREKDLDIISKEEQINKMKCTPPAIQFENENKNSSMIPSLPAVDNFSQLNEKLNEEQKTIFRYQMLLEKAHKENQRENNEHKIQINSLAKERDVALKNIKELQLILDSIPFKENDIGQQHAMFVEQIQSMSESMTVLEKQFSACRLEKSKIESEKADLERLLELERLQSSTEKDKQAVACKVRANVLQKENERLTEVYKKQQFQFDQLKAVNVKLKKEVEMNPSALLSALIKKMRDELVLKDKTIAQLRTNISANC